MKKSALKNLLFAVFTVAVACPVFAEKSGEQITEILSAGGYSVNSAPVSVQSVNSAPNSSVTLDFSLYPAESWDAKDSPNNIKTHCFSGTAITGVEYNNVTIETAAGSFLSEAVIYFSDSASGDNGLRLVIGAGNETSGTQSFSSNGILDITDNGLSDVVSLSDGVFLTQFYEKIDDFSNSVDARYIGGTLKVHGVDLQATNNCMFVQGASSDMRVQLATFDGKQQYNVGDHIEFLLSLENNGSSVASNVILESELDPALRFSNIMCSDGTTSSDISQLSALPLSDIEPSSSIECTVWTHLTESGTFNPSFSVTTDNDIDTSNNSVGIVITGRFLVIPVNNIFALSVLLLLILAATAFRSLRYKK